MKSLETNHVKETCKIGQGHDCCRYLVMGTGGFECARLVKGGAANLLGQKGETPKDLIDKRVEAKQMVARADNCGGIKMTSNG